MKLKNFNISQKEYSLKTVKQFHKDAAISDTVFKKVDNLKSFKKAIY